MTFAYLAERTIDTTEFAEWLDDVWFFSSAYQVNDWAEREDIVVLYEPEFATEAEKLAGRFVTIERKPDTEPEDVLAAAKEALQNLSTRK